MKKKGPKGGSRRQRNKNKKNKKGRRMSPEEEIAERDRQLRMGIEEPVMPPSSSSSSSSTSSDDGPALRTRLPTPWELDYERWGRINPLRRMLALKVLPDDVRTLIFNFIYSPLADTMLDQVLGIWRQFWPRPRSLPGPPAVFELDDWQFVMLFGNPRLENDAVDQVNTGGRQGLPDAGQLWFEVQDDGTMRVVVHARPGQFWVVYFADINRILGLHCTWKLDGSTKYVWEFRGVMRLTLREDDSDSELEGIDELLSVVHVSEPASSNEEETTPTDPLESPLEGRVMVSYPAGEVAEEEIEDSVSEASSSNEEVDDD